MTAIDPAWRDIERIAGAAMEAQVIRAFARLELADHMAHVAEMAKRCHLAELAVAASCRQDLLDRLLRAATGLGLCRADNNSFTLTPLGETLRSGTTNSMRDRALLLTSPLFNRAWEGLADALRSGQTPFAQRHGITIWEYLDRHESDARTYNAAMADNATSRGEALIATITMPIDPAIVDVGGGTGCLIEQILMATPDARGILADRAEVLNQARARFTTSPANDRITFAEANYLEAVPGGGNIYVLSRVLHMWSDSDALKILIACRQAMPQGARLYIVDRLARSTEPAGTEMLETALTDLNMLVLYGGQERNEAELRTLLKRAGFGRVHVLVGNEQLAIIEAF